MVIGEYFHHHLAVGQNHLGHDLPGVVHGGRPLGSKLNDPSPSKQHDVCLAR